ncbi:PelD GGDEF domain-containing protein [Candidatus Aalborgicola defluviihabitans]|uniref:PelD GGDEF domain-containing protein n=1 Tax=Candidatus Aalborgicola defluviihabitans TaxID=3386187 RepID=UPI001ED5B77F|nr:PelD GGDEF domain-containing protein [Burkholderiales bacterium]
MISPVENPAARRQMAGSESPAAPASRPAHWPSTLLGKLTTADIRPWAMAAETFLLPLIAVALGYLWNPTDPLWSQGAFPWSWLAPVILALRYGPLAGLGGAGVLLLSWLGFNVGHYDDFPQIYFLGGLILVMLVGEFSSLWQARTRRAETLQLYLDQRLEHLVRQYYLLRLSHDRLEQELIGRPMSMRDALSTLQEVGSTTQGPETLLRLLAQYCQLETAGLYPVVEDRLNPTPLASLGAVQPVLQNDPLVQQAIESRRLCHISQALATQQQSRYLIAAPLLDLGGELYGLLLIEEMPFFSLQAENLQTINLLLGYYTDGLSMQALAQPVLQALPDCSAQFAFEAQRLSHIRSTTGVPSIIVALEFLPRAIARDLPQQLQRLKRELDEYWLIATPQRQILAMLMPLGNAATAEGYIQRLEAWSQQKSAQPLAAAGVFAHVMPLNADSPLALLQRIHDLAHG